MLGPPEHASRVGGLLGFVLLVSAGTSSATALQLCYVRIWSLPRFGVIRSSWRASAWLAAFVGTFVLTGLADATFQDVPGASGVLLTFSLAGAVLFWWWTPHLLLAGRVSWRDLLPGAILTGGTLIALVWISPLLMPGFVSSGESEFGPLGTVFVVMLWLTIVCSIVVFCAIAGHVIATDPRLARLLRPAALQRSAARSAAWLRPAARSAASLRPAARSAASLRPTRLPRLAAWERLAAWVHPAALPRPARLADESALSSGARKPEANGRHARPR